MMRENTSKWLRAAGHRTEDKDTDAEDWRQKIPLNPRFRFQSPNSLEEQSISPGYYLILLRQHHTNQQRKWGRQVFVLEV